jgi:hypothetical protein
MFLAVFCILPAMDTWQHPSQDYPGLTQDRLLVMADLIRSVREDALDDHRPDKWETNWSLGVRQYERTCGAITWASQTHLWLSIISGTGGGATQYVFAIGGHPVRFCRGDEEEIAERYREPCFPELIQQEILSSLGIPTTNICLRIVIENAPDSRPIHIRLMEIDEGTGDPIRSCLIPRLARNTTVTEFAPPPVKAVEIPPVAAEAVEDESEKQNDKGKTGSDDE